MLYLLTLALLSPLTLAHFELNYPIWRGSSFLPPASQYIFPCANVNSTGNRTEWRPDGGSLVIDFHHPFTYVWINLGLGNNVSTFNISLNSMPYNETGNGTLCFPHFPIPQSLDLDLADGSNATLQVITVGDSGTALYNCADLTFTSNATLLTAGSGECQNTTGLTMTMLTEQSPNTTTTSSGSGSSSSTSSSTSSTTTGAANANIDLSSGLLLTGLLSLVSLAWGSIL